MGMWPVVDEHHLLAGDTPVVLVAQAVLALASHDPLLAQPELQVVADADLVHHHIAAHTGFVFTITAPHLDVADLVFYCSDDGRNFLRATDGAPASGAVRCHRIE